MATVLPFSADDTNQLLRALGSKLAEDVRDRLKYDFGDLFQEVRQGTPLRSESEIVITGSLGRLAQSTKNQTVLHGNSKRIDGYLLVLDARSQTVLLQESFGRFAPGYGGLVDGGIASVITDSVLRKRFEEMLTEIAASAASTVARAKGWQPKKNK